MAAGNRGDVPNILTNVFLVFLKITCFAVTIVALKRNGDDCEKVYNYWEVSEYRARGG